MVKTEVLSKYLVLVVVFTLITKSYGQVNHWESVILPGDTFSYIVPSTEPDGRWTTDLFDDSQWQVGSSGFGFGDNDDNTIVPKESISIFTRRFFQIIDIQDIDKVFLDIDFDDGFVAYINGKEIARSSISNTPPKYDQPADKMHEALLHQGGTPERFEVDPSILKNGSNILAIQVHNKSKQSTDLTLIPILSLGIRSDSMHYRQVPDWFYSFTPSEFRSSNLPVVFIETRNGKQIKDEPKIFGTMKILSNPDDRRNYLEDISNTEAISYNGKIAIEIRGSSSQALPKKQYLFTTYDKDENKENVSILGMPKENDWILNGLAYDPSLMRDYLCYELYRSMGEYASRGRYCELVINGQYRGLYILMEKLKADKNRIDIRKIKEDDLEGENLTGGYIIKSDKIEGTDVVAWGSNFIHEFPKPDEINSNQHNYIKSVFEALTQTAKEGNSNTIGGYPSIIDIPSFLNYILINELSSNVDAYVFSTYFHKDKNGKLRAGPIWDHNLTFGNDLKELGYDRSQTDIWQFDNSASTFWEDLYNNDVFRCHLSKKWFELTSPGGTLSEKEIFNLIDSVHLQIREASVREKSRWNTIESLQDNIDQLKSFIQTRSAWITKQLGSFDACQTVPAPSLVISKIHYHPVGDESVEENDLEFIEITNNGDEPAELEGIYFGGTGLTYQFSAGETLAAGKRIMLSGGAEAFYSYYQLEPYDNYTRSLDNGGQTIELLDAFGNLIDYVAYDNSEPWPAAADGEGSYLELIDLNTDNNDPSNWKAISSEMMHSLLIQENEIMIYPNPTEKMIRIDSKETVQKVEIFDQSGQSILHTIMTYHSNKLLLPDMKPGVYFINIQYEKGWVSRKLIVE